MIRRLGTQKARGTMATNCLSTGVLAQVNVPVDTLIQIILKVKALQTGIVLEVVVIQRKLYCIYVYNTELCNSNITQPQELDV